VQKVPNKIQVAITRPIPHLHTLDQHDDYHFVLAHLLDKGAYADFYIRSKKYKILDNGAYENKYPVTGQMLIDNARRIGAHELVVPDVFMEHDESMRATAEFLNESDAKDWKGNRKYMGIPQGRTLDEWLTAFEMLYNDDRIDVMGLSFLIIAQCFHEFTNTNARDVMTNRLACTELLRERGWTKKPCHLLGLGNPAELTVQRGLDFVRSMDSSSSFVHGMNGVLYSHSHGLLIPRIEKKMDFMVEADAEALGWIQHNIATLRQFSHVT